MTMSRIVLVATHWTVTATRNSIRTLSSYRGILDMGGAPGSHNIKIPPIKNTNKNCKVRAVCFDFDLLTKSVAEAEKEAAALLLLAKEENNKPLSSIDQVVLPDVGVVQQFASLLKVQLGGDDISKRDLKETRVDDDMSAILQNSTPQPDKPPASLPFSDVRSKYADKLRFRLDGGLLGVDNAKTELADSKGDASSHLAARKIAVKQGSTATRWMSMTGTGSMLQLLSNRGIHVVLLPKPDNVDSEGEVIRMQQFTKQLPSVNFDVLVKEGKDGHVVLTGVLEQLSIDPINVMLVSDRDDYILAATDLGMVTCRVTPTNARRGKTSTHYKIESIPETQEVVNEINGISFNTVLNR